MKILHTVEFYSPSIGGMQEVVRQLSERLVRMGHDVTVATTKLPDRSDSTPNGVKVIEFDIQGNLVRGLTGEIDRYRALLRNGRFDVVVNFAAQQWATDVALTMLDDIDATKVFVPTGFSSLFRDEYRNYFQSMKEWMRKYDANVFLSDDYRDIDFARANGISSIRMIPNGAGADEFLANPGIDIRAKLGIPRDHRLILQVGSHTGLKGHREAISIFRRAKIRHATLLLVANAVAGGCNRSCHLLETLYEFSPLRALYDKALHVRSLSRAETLAAYHQADLFLFPSNVECSPLVLFECMAARLPFLTTDVGNAREIIRWSNSGCLLPTVRDAAGYSHAALAPSARMLESLLGDQTARETMAEAGFAAWQQRYTWEGIAAEYAALYRELSEKKDAAGTQHVHGRHKAEE